MCCFSLGDSKRLYFLDLVGGAPPPFGSSTMVSVPAVDKADTSSPGAGLKSEKVAEEEQESQVEKEQAPVAAAARPAQPQAKSRSRSRSDWRERERRSDRSRSRSRGG